MLAKLNFFVCVRSWKNSCQQTIASGSSLKGRMCQMQNKQYECFCCGRKFDPVRSDQMFCSKACRLKHYAEVRKALADERKPRYVIKMVTHYPEYGKTVVSYFQRLKSSSNIDAIDLVGESRIAEAKWFRTKREAQEVLRVIRGCVSTVNRELDIVNISAKQVGGNCAGLKTILDEYFQKYGLTDFKSANWSVSIETTAFLGSAEAIPACVERVIRDYGELNGGRKATDDTDLQSMINLEEITMQAFAFDFLLVDMIVAHALCEEDFCILAKQMTGARRMSLELRNCQVKVFKTGIPFGYISGGVIVFFSKELNEIVVVTVYGSD